MKCDHGEDEDDCAKDCASCHHMCCWHTDEGCQAAGDCGCVEFRERAPMIELEARVRAQYQLSPEDAIPSEAFRRALTQAANEAWLKGFVSGLTEYAWWKDGEQYVGTCGTTLEKAIERAKKKYGS